MVMTLLERVQKQFAKVNLEFKLTKETYTKYVGILIDKETGTELKTEISKQVQIDRIKQFCDSERNVMDMKIKIDKMNKEGK